MSEPTLSSLDKKLNTLLRHVQNIEEHFEIPPPDDTPRRTSNKLPPENVKVIR